MTKSVPRTKWLNHLRKGIRVNTDDSNIVASVTEHVPEC